MSDFDQPVAIGIVFDLSIQHGSTGQRYIDRVKQSFVSLATQLGLCGGVFVAHPNNDDIPRTQGESVSQIANYDEPDKFSVETALRQATNIVGNQEGERLIFVVTDRFQAKQLYQFSKGPLINRTKDYGCKFYFLGIGGKYDKQAYRQLSGPDATVMHFDETDRLAAQLTKIVIVGD